MKTENKAVPIAMYCGRPAIVCPVCGEPYVNHENGAAIIESEDRYKAHPSVRGNVIRISFVGECGHHFCINFGFHKGNTFVWCDVIDGGLKA